MIRWIEGIIVRVVKPSIHRIMSDKTISILNDLTSRQELFKSDILEFIQSERDTIQNFYSNHVSNISDEKSDYLKRYLEAKLVGMGDQVRRTARTAVIDSISEITNINKDVLELRNILDEIKNKINEMIDSMNRLSDHYNNCLWPESSNKINNIDKFEENND